jgi:hypothetical protein
MRLTSLFLVLIAVTPLTAADAPTLIGEWKLTTATGGELATKLKENVARVTFDTDTVTAGRSGKYAHAADKKHLDLTLTGGPKAEQGKYLGGLRTDRRHAQMALGPARQRPAQRLRSQAGHRRRAHPHPQQKQVT